MSASHSPWILTVSVAAALAAIVSTGSLLASRHVEQISVRPAGNRVDEAFQGMVRKVASLENLWQKGLEQDADEVLSGRGRHPAALTVGVVQQSYLNPAFSDPARAHRRADGAEPVIRPVLERFLRGDAGEWPFREADAVFANRWLETPGKPLAWIKGNGRAAVVLLLDPVLAAAAAEKDMRSWGTVQDLPPDLGSLVWTGPGGDTWMSSGPGGGQPQEVMRHTSRFGDWTLRYTYPPQEIVRYRTPVLAGGLGLAVLVLAGGLAVARSQRGALKRAEERVSFVNRVSHELRTPLTNLLLNTDLALDGLGVESPKIRRRLGLIREETARLSRIVDNVLAFARMERGGRQLVLSACDVGVLVAEAEENFTPLFQRKSIICTRRVSVPRVLEVDRDSLAQIIANLLSNVEKYSGEGSRASLVAQLEDGVLVIEVSDDGPGIPARERERIFQPFERVLARVDEGASGTGLGLAISRELAGRMGGNLELLPSSHGACFRLEIPVTSQKPEDS